MSSQSDDWALVQLLAEPTRRRVFDAVRTAHRPLTRDDVAGATGVSRRLAAFHLDLLAEAGLLTVDYARPPGRSGPGAGRPAKRYAARSGDVAVSVPGRRYDLAGRLLARAGDAGADDTRAEAERLAAAEGERIGVLRRRRGRLGVRATIDAVGETLTDLGYEPQRDGDACLRLTNCPFDALVDVAPSVMCGMNHALVGGVLRGLQGHRSVTAALEPRPPQCCVTVGTRRAHGAGSQSTLPTSNA
jgi:predicted ArsR family transcriptional regulator